MFGKKKELSIEQAKKLNSLLEERYKKDKWFYSDFRGEHSIYLKVFNLKMTLDQNFLENKKELEEFKVEELEEFNNKNLIKCARCITIFNTEPIDAKPLGMVDVGQVKKFGSTSTGNRFENGLIGYAIEQAFDNVWAKNSAQEIAVNEVKDVLVIKARTLYPTCNTLFKYEVDFRELGSSGNVFIYMRATAAIGVNKSMVNKEGEIEDLVKKRAEELADKEKSLVVLEKRVKTLEENLKLIPSRAKDVETML